MLTRNEMARMAGELWDKGKELGLPGMWERQAYVDAVLKQHDEHAGQGAVKSLVEGFYDSEKRA